VNPTVAALALCMLAVGCASIDGRGLIPGASTSSDVEALMGKPSLRLEREDGGSVWYFSRLPYGREMYAATFGPDQVMRSLEPRLTRANIARLELNATARDQVRELIGPPYRIARAALKPLDVWEYPWLEITDKRILWISFSGDGVAREIIEMRDFSAEPSGKARRR
jgi:hypothetical protein